MIKTATACLLLNILALAGCAALPTAQALRGSNSYALPTSVALLGHAVRFTSLPDNQAAFAMLTNGVDGLAARLELIDASEQSLDLQYYIFRSDLSGTRIARALLRAADRGVRVRVLVDDGESVAGDERLFALAAHPLIQIRVFNPFNYRGHNQVLRAFDFVLHKKRLDHRMHNKLLVADNAISLVGGRNIGDQYFQIAPDSQFGDDDVAAVGPLVQQLSRTFDEFWNASFSIPVQILEPTHTSVKALDAFRLSANSAEKRTLRDDDLGKRLSSGEPLKALLSERTTMVTAPAQVIYDTPNKAPVVAGVEVGTLISAPVDAKAAGVETELLMITPYFVPSPAQLSVLIGAANRGARVRVLTNSLESAPAVAPHAGYARFRTRLIAANVDLHEIRARVESSKGTGQPEIISRYGNYALHAKLYIFDRKSLFVGSMNFDQRSEKLNTEIGLVIESPELAAAAAKRFDVLTQLSNAYWVKYAPGQLRQPLIWETEENGMTIDRKSEPARSYWQRLKMKVFTWLPLNKEL